MQACRRVEEDIVNLIKVEKKALELMVDALKPNTDPDRKEKPKCP